MEVNLTGTLTGLDFTTVEMGNVSDATANGYASEGVGRGGEEVIIGDYIIKRGEVFTTTVDADHLDGFQGTLQLAAGLELVNVSSSNAQATGFNLEQAAADLIGFSHTNSLSTGHVDAGGDPDHKLGEAFAFGQNSPNPFAATTRINFTLPVAGKATLTVQDYKTKNSPVGVIRRAVFVNSQEHR